MKSLGRIAYEESHPHFDCRVDWNHLEESIRQRWEAVARWETSIKVLAVKFGQTRRCGRCGGRRS